MKPTPLITILLTLFCITLPQTPASAQEKFKLDFYTRVDYNWIDGTDVITDEYSGFKGRYLFIRGEGNLGDGFHYSFAQRLNVKITDNNFFDATDWSFLDYTTPRGGWTFSAGKIVLDVGSYEYDGNPIDIPFFSQYNILIEAYLFGTSVTRHATENDDFMFILTRSPYDTPENNHLAYTLEWRAHHGCWHPIYTIGCSEQDDFDPFMTLGLGNLFKWNNGYLETDFVGRQEYGHRDLSKSSFTTSMRAQYKLTDRTALICKTVFDYNKANIYDRTIPMNTNTRIYGAGVEFYPVKSEDIRLFGIFAHACGDFGGVPNHYNRIDLGIKWKVNLLSIK